MTNKLQELNIRLKELGVNFKDLRPFLLAATNFELSLKKDVLGFINKNNKSFISVDFLSKSLSYRSASHINAELVVKAVKGRNKQPQIVLDATAGFGKDAYLLALSGCDVTANESNPLMHLMLLDGMNRLKDNDLKKRLKIKHHNSLETIKSHECDVIYLDPMYPENKKSAKTNKQMDFLQNVIGHQSAEAGELLELSMQSKAKKVVLKRPDKSPYCLDFKPTSQIIGKAVRYDVYVVN